MNRNLGYAQNYYHLQKSEKKSFRAACFLMKIQHLGSYTNVNCRRSSRDQTTVLICRRPDYMCVSCFKSFALRIFSEDKIIETKMMEINVFLITFMKGQNFCWDSLNLI